MRRLYRKFKVGPERPSGYSGGVKPLKLNKNIQAPKGRKGICFRDQTFAIRARKRSFLGIQRLETLDFTGVDFQNAL